jgi:hypothetical protein
MLFMCCVRISENLVTPMCPAIADLGYSLVIELTCVPIVSDKCLKVSLKSVFLYHNQYVHI